MAKRIRKNRKIDRINARHHEIAMETKVISHVRFLHPTKGYRRESKLALYVRRLSPAERLSVHVGIIKKAQDFTRKAG